MTAEPRSVLSLRERISHYLDRHFTTSTMSYHQVIAIFIPVLLDYTLVSLLGVINSSMISSSGPEAVAGLNMVDPLNAFLMFFFIAVSTGGTVVVAQYWGRRDIPHAAEAMGQTILTSALISFAIIAVILSFRDPILYFLFGDADPLVMEHAKVYLTGSCISYPFFAIYQAVAGALYGSGDTKAAMVLSILMNVVYLGFNIIFLRWLNMSMLGLTISLNLARGIFALLGLIYLFYVRKDISMKWSYLFKMNCHIQKSVLAVGIPSGLEQVFFNGGKLLTQTFVVGMGFVNLTANAIAGSLTILLYIPANALTTTITTCVGQCIGAGHHDEAKKYIRNLMGAAFVLQILTILLFLPAAPWLISLYKPPAECVPIIMGLLVICCIGLPVFWSGSNLLPSALRAAGDAKFTSIVALICMWACNVIPGYILGVTLHMGVYGIWIAMISEWGIRTLLNYLRQRGTKWYSHKLID